MTRINLVDPKTLSRQHLVAEYRELPRVFKLAEKWMNRPNREKVPETYRMGKGHVLFFYDKIGWLIDRHKTLCDEMRSRGYSTNINCENWREEVFPQWMFVDYEPNEEEIAINKQRIKERSK